MKTSKIKDFKLLNDKSEFTQHYYTKSQKIAYNLHKYGVREIVPCYHFIAGYEDVEHLICRNTSITCYPYIEVKFKDRVTPILWALLRYFDIKYSGGAGKSITTNYMQASTNKEDFQINDILIHFLAIKDFNKRRGKRKTYEFNHSN